MINSISNKIKQVQIPDYTGQIKMLPFNLSDLNQIPEMFKQLIEDMLSVLPERKGIAYLTIDGKIVEAGNSQRRAGVHIDGNYLESLNWGTPPGIGGGNGWKVGEGGRILSSEEHKKSYMKDTGGMLIASTYPGCRGWNGKYEGDAYVGGDCSRIKIEGDGYIMEPNILYYGNSQFLHESLPLDKTIKRVMVRITLPEEYPVINFK